MILHEVLERFEKRAPVCVMVRAALENVLSVERLDALFEATAEWQTQKQLAFSTVADIMGLVALKIHPSVHAAYQNRKEEVGVTVKALYDKLQRTESCVSREVVRETASRMQDIIEHTQGAWAEPLPGYRTKILDGNHLRRTQRRLQELSELNAAPLPGHCLVVLDPRTKLAIDVFPCEDAHTQERKLLPAVLETVERKDLWIGDRNFCTSDFLWGIHRRSGAFVIRQHSNALRYELIGKRKKIGRSETGVVYEQSLRLYDAEDQCINIRRITVELDQPTRDGDREIHLLTNLPKKPSALHVAELYRGRWTIETAFGEVAQNLEGEIETLGYPRAALFAFCMALVAFNLLSVLRAAFRAAHELQDSDQDVSMYYFCDEVAHTYRGLEIVFDDDYWEQSYATLTPQQLAKALVRIARQATLSRYKKHRRGPKKPQKKMNKKHRNHVSTARILNDRSGYRSSIPC